MDRQAAKRQITKALLTNQGPLMRRAINEFLKCPEGTRTEFTPLNDDFTRVNGPPTGMVARWIRAEDGEVLLERTYRGRAERGDEHGMLSLVARWVGEFLLDIKEHESHA